MEKRQVVERLHLSLILSAVLAGAAGCSNNVQGASDAVSHRPMDGEHKHPTEGPHHGGLIELGDEAYHAELVHDEKAREVIVYVLDSTAKNAAPIAAQELLINVSHEGQAEQFTLAASPEANDPPGKSSRFAASDATLAEELDHGHAGAHLVATIAGKQYRGAIGHDHSHEHTHSPECEHEHVRDHDHAHKR